jgi:hypothetical protein
MYNSDLLPEEVSLGEEFTVLVLRGKGGSIISRMEDGRVILFNRESPIFRDLKPGVSVYCRVIFIAENYVIVDPTSPPESGIKAIRLGLRMLSESEDWEMGVIGQALLYIVERLEEEE